MKEKEIRKTVGMWDGELMRLYLPIECPECGKQVSIGGAIDSGELQVDKCPNCGAQFEIAVTQATDEPPESEYDAQLLETTKEIKVTVGVENFGRIEKCSLSLSGFSSAVNILTGTITQLCKLFSDREYPAELLQDLVVRALIPETYPPLGIRQLIDRLEQFLAAQETEPETVKPKGPVVMPKKGNGDALPPTDN